MPPKATMCMKVTSTKIIPPMASDYHAILILGGTKEAAKLAQTLHDKGHKVITSLAGRTKEPKPLAGKTHIGGFGGVEGLSAYVCVQRIQLIIDATHPFARQISANVKAASIEAGVPLIQYQRPLWVQQEGDQWQTVPTLDAAREAIPQGATVLLALGRQYIAPFAERGDVRFIIRMVDKPEAPLAFKKHTLLLGLPKPTAAEEAALFAEHKITHILCRNSGGNGAYAKIEAARNLGLPVIMLSRL